jgi:PAS domain S-box-containing protein
MARSPRPADGLARGRSAPWQGPGALARFRTLFDEAPDAFFVVDDRRRYVHANRAACVLLGVPLARLRGRRVEEFFEPGRPDLVQRRFERLLREGTLRDTSHARRPDGSVRTVEFSARAHLLPGRHLVIIREAAAAGSGGDVGPLVDLLDVAPVLVVGVDTGGRVRVFNRACETVTGFAREQILGQSLEALVPRPWWRSVARRLRAGRPAELAEAHVYPWRTSRGRERMIDWRSFYARLGGEVIVLKLGRLLEPDAEAAREPARAPAEEGAAPGERPRLSRREWQVLTLAAGGHTNRDIAARIGVGVKTVETYRARLARKVGRRRRSDLVSLALDLGLLGT